MKWGKVLDSNVMNKWRTYYISYKPLKKIIKQMKAIINPLKSKQPNGLPKNFQILSVHDLKSKFQEIIEADLKRVEIFYCQHERELLKAINNDINTNGNDDDSDLNGGNELKNKLKEKVRNLDRYAYVNAEGFRKILKKFDKFIKFSNFNATKYYLPRITLLNFYDHKKMHDLRLKFGDKLKTKSDELNDLKSPALITKNKEFSKIQDNRMNILPPITTTSLNTITHNNQKHNQPILFVNTMPIQPVTLLPQPMSLYPIQTMPYIPLQFQSLNISSNNNINNTGCNNSFSSNTINNNSNYIEHFCTFCNKKFTDLNELATHLRNHVKKSKKYKCNICHHTFNKQYLLNEHYKLHRNSNNNGILYKCGFCAKHFSKKKDLAIHQQKMHNNNNASGIKYSNGYNTKILTNNNDYKYCCLRCNKKFMKPNELIIHEQQGCLSKIHDN